ncbi:MAG TPA: flippase-like domain-containing protein [Solirubrobacteraceae bacterium]|nr:flippase-like domain-containing protein [Solirubrobacteraceae bacterium]
MTSAQPSGSSEPGRISRGAIVKRLVAVTVAGLALYGLAPKLGHVLGAWPRLRDIKPGWFAVMAVTESASVVCMCAVQRIAAQEHRWAPFLHSYLAGNAVSELVPGGAATSAALQYEMLVDEGVPSGRAASGMAAGSLIVFGTLLLLNVVALPIVVLGVSVPSRLLAAAWISAALLLGIVLIGSLALRGDQFLTFVGRTAQWILNKFRRHSEPVQDLPERLLAQRTAVVQAVGSHWWQALLAAGGKWVFDYLTLVFALAAVGAHPNVALVLVAYSAASLLGQIPLTPGGLGVVEAGLTGALALIGVKGGAAVLATLAYRIFNYWLYLPAGLVSVALHRRAIRARNPPDAGDP